MHEWSLVINLLRGLTIQTTFKIDSISLTIVCIFKTFSKQNCLDYYIKIKNVHLLQKNIGCPVSAENAFHNIFLPPLWTDETVMCALAECTWYFEDLAFCLFKISFQHWKIQVFMTPNLLHSHFCSKVGFFKILLAALS